MPMQQGSINLNWTGNNMFSVYANEGNIYFLNGEQIGVSLVKYQEMEQAFQKCRNKLVELGVIVPEKTPEEIIKEQSELLAKQTEVCNNLMLQMQEMSKKLENIGENNGFRANKNSDSIIADSATEQTESTASMQSSSTDSKPANELHKGRSTKTTSTK